MIRHIYPLPIVLSLVACSGSSGLSGEAKHASANKTPDAGDTTASSGDSSEEEAARSGQPQQVSGAFLTGCAPTTEDSPDATHDAFGCATVSRKSGLKYPGVTAATVVITKSDGTTVKPPTTMAPGTSQYNFYFQTAKGATIGLLSMAVNTTIDGHMMSWANVPMHADPSGDTSSWLGTSTSGPQDVSQATGSQYMFISNASLTPGGNEGQTFNGLSDADYFCNWSATNAGVDGAWIAVMGDSKNNVQSRVNIQGAVSDMSGAFLAGDPGSFWAAHPGATLDEGRNPIGAGAKAWSGSSADGITPAQTCQDWTSAQAGTVGTIGDSSNQVGGWLSVGPSPCNVPQHIYCISSASSPPTVIGTSTTVPVNAVGSSGASPGTAATYSSTDATAGATAGVSPPAGLQPPGTNGATLNGF